jgi:hypothetical protein
MVRGETAGMRLRLYWYCVKRDSVVPGHVGLFVLGWAQDERPADLHMAQPNVPVSKTGHIAPAKVLSWMFVLVDKKQCARWFERCEW